MRGKDFRDLQKVSFVGITPACAGKRHCPRFRLGRIRDHPRVCGEKALSALNRCAAWGSPPRMRGKVCSAVDDECQPGITPACAGKSQGYQCHTSGYKDHPHVCGEKLLAQLRTGSIEGSPPRMRGKVLGKAVLFDCHGITPAYAGKSCRAVRSRWRARDHPRVCGEKTPDASSTTKSIGSPPRMRRKGHRSIHPVPQRGITPAYAGKSLRLGNNPSTSWDHPRVCGEKTTQTAPTPVSPISSMARWVTRVPGPSSSTEMPAAGI